MTLLFVVLMSRVYWVQVVKGDEWYDRAKSKWATQEKLPPTRGTITDRDGNVLAMDVTAYTVAVNPKLINSLGLVDETAQKLHSLLGKSESDLRQILTAKKDNGDYYVQREIHKEGWKIDKPLADKVAAFRDELKKKVDEKDVGIYLLEEQGRYYPRSSLASHLIGYITKEGEAKTGIEAFYNEQLKGEAGYLKYEKDGKKVQLAGRDVDYKPARDGSNITLTIDNEIQHYVEQAIREVVKEYQPKSVTAIAADPNTMEILAIANMPEYNPNEYWKYPQANFFNHAIKSLYEPGSTFKIVTLAAAVQENMFNPNEMYKSGSIQVGRGKPIRDHRVQGWGTISFLDGLKLSSNVEFVKLGYERLGAEKLDKYIKNFGFGVKTGIALGSETAGLINFDFDKPIEVATASFGQGPVLVSPIQQVAAVAAVANGGKLLQPQLIKSIEDPVAQKVQKIEPKVVRNVISKDTATKVGEYLEHVVSDREIGTGRNAYIEGYRVAGKTGTAQKVVSGNKDYSKEKYVVSFIGFAPVDNPKIVVYIVVDEPNDPTAGGGAVAAPVFKEIVLKSLRHMGVAPNWKGTEAEAAQKEVAINVPELTGRDVAQAKSEMKARALPYELVGKGSKVLQQIPSAGTSVHPTQKIYLITEKREKLTVPNMKGLSLRDAMEVSSLLGIRLVSEGEGYVVSQKEEKTSEERILKVKLQPPTGAAPAQQAKLP